MLVMPAHVPLIDRTSTIVLHRALLH